MREETINELTNFLKEFGKGKTINKCHKVNNLSFDKMREAFFKNMDDRGLAVQTKNFYNNKLKVFGNYLILIKIILIKVLFFHLFVIW